MVNDMRKFLIVLTAVAALVVTISLSVIAASMFSNRREEGKLEGTNMATSSENIPFVEAVSSGPEEESTPKYMYLVKRYNGSIGIFNAGETIPFRMIDTDVSLLPSFDRIALEDGIKIYSDEELDAIIEDFDS